MMSGSGARVPVIIVGAGPAGSALGMLLAERGVEGIVLDRAAFPRAKPCGELLNPGAVCALARLGFLDAVLARRPAQIRRWSIQTDGAPRAVGRYAAEAPWGLGIPRNALDAALVSEARARGVQVHERTTVQTVRRNGDGWIIEARRDSGAPARWRADILVGADGLRSTVARRLGMVRRPERPTKLSLTCHLEGLGPERETGFLVRHRAHTLGLAPVHGTRCVWNATVVVDVDEYGKVAARDRMDLFWTILRDAGLPWASGPALVAGPWVSSGFAVAVAHPATDAALLIGDAAGYFDPFTGQGIYQALRSAELAAAAIGPAMENRRRASRRLHSYVAAIRRARAPTALFQRGVEFVMSRDRLRSTAIAALNGAPRYADTMVQVAGDHRPVSALCHVGGLLMSRGRSS